MSRVCLDVLIKSDESGFACSKTKLVESGLPHLRPFNVSNDGRLDLSEVYQVPETEAPLGKTYLDAGDILFNNTNSAELVGKSALVQSPMRAGFSNHMNRIRLDTNQIEPAYFAFWLKRQRDIGFFTSQATQWVSQAAYKTSEMRKLEIELPTLPEQRRIVDFLSRAEGIVRLRREAEKKAAELIPALFLDMFGDPGMNPKGWPVKLLGDLAAREKYAIKAGPFGSALKKEMYVPTGYKIYGQEQVIRDDLSYGDYYIDDTKYQELESCKIQSHDLLISLVGTFGKISIVPETFQPGIINPRLMKVTLDRSRVLPRFLKALLTGNTMRARIEDRSHGGTMSIVNVGIMKSLEIFVPPLALQSQFCGNADAMLSVQTQQSAATTKAKATFDALLAQAFSA